MRKAAHTNLIAQQYISHTNPFFAFQHADYVAFANRWYIHRLELSNFTLRTLYTDVTKNFIAFDYDYRYILT